MAAAGCLVVILAADVVDTPRPTEANEEGGRDRLEALRQDFAFPKIAERNGRILTATGERLLAEFTDPTEAVRCAVDMQRGMIDRNLKVAQDRRIALRVGINMGEMKASGDDLVSRAVAALPIGELATLIKPGAGIYGDGVNRAVLIAALAEPGGICLSGPVRDAVHDKFPHTFEDLGAPELDTLATPARCYRVSATTLAATPHIAGQNRRRSANRDGGLRGAAVAAGVIATVGIWSVALWAWLGTNSSKGPASPPMVVGSQVLPTTSSDDKDTRAPAPSASKTADASTAGSQLASTSSPATDRASRDTFAAPPPLAIDPAADRSLPTPAARPSLPDIGPVVVRGRQGLRAPAATAESGSAAVSDAQAPQAAPDIVTAVFRGSQGQPETTPDTGTAVVRGNQGGSGLQRRRDSSPDVVRGSGTVSRAEPDVLARRSAQGSSEP